MAPAQATGKGGMMRLQARLDAVNFFLADVRGGLGPYVGVFLLTAAGWDQAEIGAVLTISGLIGITAHAPIGAFIDVTHGKRAMLVAATLAFAGCAIAIERAPVWPVVLTADIVMAVLGAIFAPVVAAMTLGLAHPEHLVRRIGRNAVFDRIGNVFIAAVAGAAGWWFGQRTVFWLVPLFTMPALWAVLSIPAHTIDHARARGLEVVAGETAVSGWRLLLSSTGLLLLALLVAAFHFANSSMLPLIAQKLALAHPGAETPFVSACILAAQIAAIPAGWIVGVWAGQRGRYLLLIVSCILLPVRGVIFALSDNAYVLVATQVLDGIGVGMLETLIPILLTDLMKGTGRYSAARGLLGLTQGIGGSISNVVSGVLVVWFGYATTFLALSATSLAALGLALALRSAHANGET